MKEKIVTFLILILFFPLFSAKADLESAKVFFKKANQSYEEGRYDQAIQEYEKILGMGIKNFKVFYNLGNAYFRQNQLGKAILNYRKALLLQPRDEDVKANLSFVKLFTLDKIQEQKINPFSNMIYWFLNLLSTDEFAVLTSLFYTFSMAIGILMLFRRTKRFLRVGFVTSLIFMAIFGFSLLGRIYLDSLDYGVVIVPQVEVRSGPGKDYILQFTGHEGLEFKIDEESEGWYRISLPNGIKGWIPKEAVEII